VHDRPTEYRRGEYVFSTDRRRLDLDAALRLLRATHWAGQMSREVLARAVANSLSAGVYHSGTLVAFARVVTDLATYAYMTDVVVDSDFRGRGLGRWLIECLLEHPDLQELRRVALITRDAQGLYSRLGFGPLRPPLSYLERRKPEPERSPSSA
jgi:ribosomal protein S18 acetylase RimI-like enzyme